MTSIGDYALLGDLHGAALVSRDGSVDWWCAPRFDAPSLFTRILDPAAGHWRIAPAGGFTVEREYVEDTMVLRTAFRCSGGRLVVTDALALGHGERDHAIGARSPHALLRLVEAVEGEVEVEVDVAPRPEYGLVTPRLRRTPVGIEATGGADALTLVCHRKLEITGDARATARFTLRAGESAAFSLQHHRAGVGEPPPPLDARAALADTVSAWRSWASMHRAYTGPYAREVRRSALVLQALTYAPTGAIVAAPTTSLPEQPGGSANWDYRFSWLRDGSFTLKALWVGACPDEAQRFFDWIARSAGPSVASGHVQIMLGVEGEHDLTEHELPHLRGFDGSAPVRVGNDAWDQTQLDVLGEVLEGAWVLRDQLGEIPPPTAEFLCSLADRAAETWVREDSGIWEGREGDRHYLTSKLMCWVALDRAVMLASRLGEGADPERWASAREEVRQAILERGWSERAGAYSGAFGSHHLDAGVLLMPIMGFLPATDERMHRTIDAIERELSRDGLVQRWTGAGDEGAFVICSYWLAACRALAGEVQHAKRVFAAVTAHANDLGLLAEEVDLRTGALLGNFPQGLSHIGLINAAWIIAQAEADGQEHGHDEAD